MSLNSESEVMNYLSSAENLDDDEKSKMLNDAKKHNENLIGNISIGDPFSSDQNSADDYN